MKINIKLIGSVSTRVDVSGELDVEDNISLRDLKINLGLPENYPVIFTVNGVNMQSGTLLSDGDKVCIFNIMSGG